MKRLIFSALLFLITLPAQAIANNHVKSADLVVIKNATTKDYDFVLPGQTIEAPDKVELGDVVVVKAGSIDEPPKYLVGTSYRWLVYQDGKEYKNYQLMPDGTSVFFGSGVKSGRKFTVILSASYLYVVKDEKDQTKVLVIAQRAKLMTAQVVVGEAVPEPPAPPQPPGPSPTFPDGKYKLSKTAYDMVMLRVANNTNRAKAANALSKSFAGISSAIKAGTITNLRDVLTKTQQSNNSALGNVGVSVTEWNTFFTELQPMIYNLYNSNTMTTVADFATAWDEIAIGLGGVR